MTHAPVVRPEPIGLQDLDAVLALNNRHAAELSWLEPDRLRHLLAQAFIAHRIGRLDAFVIAFDESADYDSPNFLWFRARYPRFVYVDRIAVDAAARGRGLARQLYETLIELAARMGHGIIGCEVNVDPPNPGSDAFHAALGFREVGSAAMENGRAVRYFEKRIG